MNKDIRELIETLKRGKYEDPTEKIDLLAAALKEQGGAEASLLITLLEAPQVPLKLAAIEACRNRREVELASKVRELGRDKDTRVKVKVADVLPDLPANTKEDEILIATLVEDESYEVRSQAIKATTGKEEFVELQRDKLANDPAGWVRFMASKALSANKSPELVSDFLVRFAHDDYDDLQVSCAEAVEKRMTDSMKACEPFLPTDITLLERVKELLTQYNLKRLSKLSKWVSEKTKSQVNPAELQKYGMDLTAAAVAHTLPHAFGVDDVCDSILKVITGKEPRSLVLLGETGVGKSAIINELVYRLVKLNQGWHVLRVSPTEFLADTKYVGEWQTRVSKLVDLISRPRRVILYIPKLSDLHGVGRYEGSQADVANALAPHIEDGSIIVIGESTPDEYEKGLGGIPALRRLFDSVLVQEPTAVSTREILAKVRDENKANIPDDELGYLSELADQYLNQSSRPGNAVGLLREVLASHSSTEPVSNRMILDTISKSTGIPSEFLDDSIPLDLNAVKAFFDSKVMGQPEAVEAVMDLITLIKSGLTDPNKPFGVMLFVGPTGVGKTELARALAEYVFGDAGRLQRFDMSEFASYEGYERLIGADKGPGMLTSAVRRTPFSVVLLDEIEKSHVNVYDLCLQIFDAGRLTDGKGKTVNFRQTIVILTSNVGATSSGGVLGFGAPGQQPPSRQEADKERTFRELSRVFRPEFLNRIDRIINFRPLTLQITESIARREINMVLERSGIARRNIVVDVDPSVIALLVKEGYSPNFGARPLKRAVERSMLLPLARSIATGRITGKTVLRATAVGNKIEFKIISKPADSVLPKEEKREEPLLEIATQLLDGYESLEAEIEPMVDRKTDLLEESRKPGFYQDRVKMSATFDEIHRLDQFLSVYEGLGKAISGLYGRVSRKVAKGEEEALSERLNQLGDELDQIRFIATSDDARDLSDVLIVVSLVDREGEALNAVDKLVKLYSAFARRRRLSAEIIAEVSSDKEDTVHLHITGMGAFMFYKNEAGLHQFASRYKERAQRSGKEKHLEDTEVVRVDVFPADAQPDKVFSSKLKVTANAVKSKATRYLTTSCYDVNAFHEPSLRSFRGLVSGEKDDAVGRAQFILYTLVKDGAPPNEADEIARVYELGMGPKIKDSRSGKVITKVDWVLKGHLEPFLPKIRDQEEEE